MPLHRRRARTLRRRNSQLPGAERKGLSFAYSFPAAILALSLRNCSNSQYQFAAAEKWPAFCRSRILTGTIKFSQGIRAKPPLRLRQFQLPACEAGGRGVQYRMKKLFFLLCLLPLLTMVGFAQASRQDASASYVGTYQPTINGNGVTQTSTFGNGVLLGYRFMLTPTSALQANYQYTRFHTNFVAPFSQASIYGSMQEGSISYVRSFVYKKFNPFVEGGMALLLFTPIDNTHTSTNAGTRSKAPAGVFGGGIAYELSPSWDLRVEYRAYLSYANNYGIPQFKTDRYEYFINQPTVGFAYHF